MKLPVYLDHMATTPVDARVRAAMDAVYDQGPANPHSSTHAYGWKAAGCIDHARSDVSALIGARPDEILFTSGATEANNLALSGAVRASGRRRIVVSAIEHPCVLETARALERDGCELTVLDVDASGLVDPDDVVNAIDSDTALVSIMLANHETGTIEPVAEIGALCRERDVLFHTDAVQAVSRIPIDVVALNADLLSLSAHKMYGPMGIGALYLKAGTQLEPVLYGGAQQGGFRAGTVPTPLAAGFGKAAQLVKDGLASDAGHLSELSIRLFNGLQASIPDLLLIGPENDRVPGCLTVRVPGLNAEDWLLATPSIAASSGAACASGDGRPSHVLRAMGLSAEQASGAIRLSVGRATAVEEIEIAAAALVESYAGFAANT